MTYLAYERTAGTSCLNEVQAMERHLTDNGTFGTATIPTLSQVEEFITDTYYDISTKLVINGYDQSQTDTDVLGVLQHFNALGACAKIELTQPSVGYKTGENTRYDRFFKEYEKIDKFTETSALERLGATRSWNLSDGLTAGGISISDKEAIETDADHVPYFFRRDLHKHVGTKAIEEGEYKS